MYCGRVEELHECGHATITSYINCGLHEDDEFENQNCHNSKPKSKDSYVSMRRGSDKCFFPCKVSEMGWLCCICGHKKKRGWVDAETDMPMHKVEHRDGSVEYHEFCCKCKVIDTGLSSRSDLQIYSGASSNISTVLSGEIDLGRPAHMSSYVDAYQHVDNISNLERMVSKPLHVPSSKKVSWHDYKHVDSGEASHSSKDMYESLMSGAELVLDLHTSSDKRMFKDLLSMISVREGPYTDRRANVGAARTTS